MGRMESELDSNETNGSHLPPETKSILPIRFILSKNLPSASMLVLRVMLEVHTHDKHQALASPALGLIAVAI